MTAALRKIGLIGDVHAEHHRLELAITHLRDAGAEKLICTGDIVDGRGCPNASVSLLREADVETVRGNHDRWVLEEKARHIPDAHLLDELDPETVAYLAALPAQLSLETIHGRLLLCHGVAGNDLKKIWPGTERMPVERCSTLDAIIESGEYKYLVNGHMHFRTMIHFTQLTLINAGTLKGEHWPGFSLLDFENHLVRAFEFHEGTVRQVQEHPLTDEKYEVFIDTRCFEGGWDPVRLF